MPGLLTALLAKMTGLGMTAKAIFAVTAALTVAVAGGATGILALPGGRADNAVVATGAVQQPAATANRSAPSAPVASGEAALQTGDGSSAPPPAPSTSTRSSTRVATAPDASSAKLPTFASPTRPTIPNASLPTIPASPAIPRCVADLIPSRGALPDPVQLAAQLPACILSVVTASLPLDTIQSVIGSANLPVDVSRCLSAVVSSLPSFTGGNLSGLPQLLSGCLPTGSISGMTQFPGIGSIPGAGR